MNWLIFTIFAAAAVALETGLGTFWQIAGATPSLLLILAVFVALAAPSASIFWAMLVLGLLADSSGAHEVIGPAALAFLAGGYVARQMRGLFYRDSPLALAVAVLPVGVFVRLVIAALLTARNLPFMGGASAGWDPADYLMRSFLDLLYTMAAALPAGWLLNRTRSWWRFPTHAGVRGY